MGVRWKPVKQDADQLIKWDQPKELVGWYRGSERRDHAYGENLIHFLDTVDGQKVGFFGTVQLNDALSRVAEGTLVRIVYTGKTAKAKGGTVKIFEVYEAENEGDDTEGAGEADAPPVEEEVPF